MSDLSTMLNYHLGSIINIAVLPLCLLYHHDSNINIAVLPKCMCYHHDCDTILAVLPAMAVLPNWMYFHPGSVAYIVEYKCLLFYSQGCIITMTAEIKF